MRVPHARIGCAAPDVSRNAKSWFDVGDMQRDDRSDASLWLEAIAGTTESFGAIYDRYRQLLFRVALSRVANVNDAEDVVAMVFLEAWRKRAEVRIVDGSLRPWLLVVTSNVIRTQNRTKRRHRRLLAKLPPAEDSPDVSQAVLDRLHAERFAAVAHDAIRKLHVRDQQVVELCILGELSMPDAAAALNIPVGTVKSRLARVRRRLQVELGDLERGQDGARA